MNHGRKPDEFDQLSDPDKADHATADPYADLLRDLYSTGISVPGCGGGPHTHPSWSIKALSPRYGDSLAAKCLEFVCHGPVTERRPECVEFLAGGIVYQLMGEEPLPRLIAAANIPRPPGYQETAEEKYRLTMIRSLIAAICLRNGTPPPAGIDPIDDQMTDILFEG